MQLLTIKLLIPTRHLNTTSLWPLYSAAVNVKSSELQNEKFSGIKKSKLNKTDQELQKAKDDKVFSNQNLQVQPCKSQKNWSYKVFT